MTATLGVFPVSSSTLTVAGCGWAINQKFNKVPQNTMPSALAQFGSDIHNVLDAINKQRIPVDDNMMDILIAKYVTSDFEKIRQHSVSYLDYFPIKDVLASELKLGLDKDLKPCDFNDAIYRGIIDVILNEDDGITICDHKSGFAVFPSDTPQNRFYAWLVNRHFPNKYNSIGMAIHFVRAKEIRYSTRRIFNFANLERSIVASAARAWNTPIDAPPSPGKQCTFCNWANTCPAVSDGRIMITTQEQAIKTAEECIVLDRRLGEARTKLKLWAEINGNVLIDDGKFSYGFQKAASYSADVDEVLKKLEEFPSLRANISVSKPKNLLEHPANLNITKHTKTSFKGLEVKK